MISVIIPTYNEEKYLPRLLKAVSRCEHDDYELIVVDNHSKDATVKIAREQGCQVFKRKERGIGFSRNYGVMKSHGDIVAHLDADSIPCDNWIDKVLSGFTDRNVLGLGGPTYYGKLIPDVASSSIFISNILTRPLGFYFFAGNNSAYRKDFFLKTGGFKNIVLEEIEFSKRMAPYYSRFKFDKDMMVRLSTRRFDKNGTFETLLYWYATDIDIMMGKYKSPESYSETF
ncbi:MAG: glycosyltransferase [Candidatus Micrarchaeia archaeon]|jgi:glycosyltransferase involved in cell wall biosynthesis